MTLAFVAAVTLTTCQRHSNAPVAVGPRVVQLEEVTSAGGQGVREFTGRVEQTSISPLAFQVSGRIIAISALEGTQVRRGQGLARIDAEPYALVLRRADAQYRQLAEDLKRKMLLRDDGILSQAGFEQLQARADMARAQRDLARRDVRNTSAGGSRHVWRHAAAQGRVHAVPVTLQEVHGDDATVNGDLHVGERVVAGGAAFVTEGQQIEPLGSH